MKKIDAVFEGGGVKGSGLLGAVAYTESLGYEFENLAGTSAGAIVAALLAAGYKAPEIKKIFDEIDYTLFKDVNIWGKIPYVGVALNLLFQKGIYEGDFFEKWIEKLLADKGVKTFGDLVLADYIDDPRYKYKLQVIASDISRGQLLVLPRDAAEYGMAPDDLSVARAVRMSMSIPYFFKPVTVSPLNSLLKSYVVDGGILSNFPVWIFDAIAEEPLWPTIGYKLVDPNENSPHTIRGPITLFAALFSTMMEAHDARYIKDTNFMRTIPIPTLGVNTTDFNLTQQWKDDLFASGFTAAETFFKTWSFEAYKKEIAVKAEMHRAEKLWTKPV